LLARLAPPGDAGSLLGKGRGLCAPADHLGEGPRCSHPVALPLETRTLLQGLDQEQSPAEGGRGNPASTWALPNLATVDRPDHPTPKPLDAFEIPMRQHVAWGGLCYEPFCGSGSQSMAGEANGRRVFAMEISPAYIGVAVERWQADTGCCAILDGDGRTFAPVRTERLGDGDTAPTETTDSDADPEPARQRKTAA